MKKLMAANWKMFKTWAEAEATAAELAEILQDRLPADREALIIPPFISIKAVADAVGKAPIQVGAQNFHPAEEGAFTGEISPRMLTDLCCTYALAGHSERRHVFGEDDATVSAKTAYGLEHGLRMILCIGETIEERKAGRVEEVLDRQLAEGLKGVSAQVKAEDIVIAYEPVWAIGTGEVAGPEEIVEAHGFVRKKLQDVFSEKGSEIRVLYGGSVKPDNCAEIIALDNVDGVLVGGASLMATSFGDIVLAGN